MTGNRVVSLVLLALLLALGGTARAQAQPDPAQPPPAATPAADRYDARVPVGAVRAYIDACRAGDYDRAAGFLDLRGLTEQQRSDEGARLARQLKTVLDRTLWIRYEQLSANPEGQLDDGLPPALDRLEGQGEISVLIERVADDRGEQVWRIAESTVARIPELYAEHGYGPLGEVLPAALFELRLFEIQLWQWIGLILLVLVAWVLSWVGAIVFRLLARPITARTRSQIDDRLVALVTAPLRLLIGLGLFVLGTLFLGLSLPAYGVLANVEKAVAVVAATWIALRAVDVAGALLGERLAETRHASAAAILPLGRRAVKTFVIALAVVGVLQNLGFEVTGLLAGLGVGGLAVALAAQKSIENLFGGVTIIADQPVRVGDYCRFGDKTGTVEEIGLRSTRIRTLDRTRITVPNSSFSELQLENFATRDRIRLTTVLGLRYETTPDQLRYVLAELRRVLLAHPRLTDDPARVRFSAFGAHSLDVEVFTYVLTTDWAEYQAIREDVYLRFMDVIGSSGSGFAFPSQTLYLGRDGGLDAARGGKAEAQVRSWREESRLPFPDFAPEVAAGLSGTADYPPRGSSVAASVERFASDDDEA